MQSVGRCCLILRFVVYILKELDLEVVRSIESDPYAIFYENDILPSTTNAKHATYQHCLKRLALEILM